MAECDRESKEEEGDPNRERPDAAGADLDVTDRFGDAERVRLIGGRRTQPLLSGELVRDVHGLVDTVNALSHHRDDDPEARKSGAHAFAGGNDVSALAHAAS